jgi:hypothetical protein
MNTPVAWRPRRDFRFDLVFVLLCAWLFLPWFRHLDFFDPDAYGYVGHVRQSGHFHGWPNAFPAITLPMKAVNGLANLTGLVWNDLPARLPHRDLPRHARDARLRVCRARDPHAPPRVGVGVRADARPASVDHRPVGRRRGQSRKLPCQFDRALFILHRDGRIGRPGQLFPQPDGFATLTIEALDDRLAGARVIGSPRALERLEKLRRGETEPDPPRDLAERWSAYPSPGTRFWVGGGIE